MNSILSRSASDREFRQTLLTDPRSAILTAFGVRIPESFALRFIEKPPELAALIVLPELTPPGELSDKDLESVAGGVAEDYDWGSTPPDTGG